MQYIVEGLKDLHGENIIHGGDLKGVSWSTLY